MVLQKKILLIIALAASILVAACAQGTTTNPQTAQERTGVNVGDLAPSFSVTTIDGRTFTRDSAIAEGKPTIIYFMSSGCAVCARNWPSISEVYPEYASDVNFVAVSVDLSDKDSTITALAQERGFTFPAASGNPQMAVDFRVLSQTANFVLDSDGRIVSKGAGELSLAQWRALFETVA